LSIAVRRYQKTLFIPALTKTIFQLLQPTGDSRNAAFFRFPMKNLVAKKLAPKLLTETQE
jgi:hypothetical protein